MAARADLPAIHGLKAGAGKSLEKSEKRAVQAARNGPSEDRQYWQRVEPDIHSLNRWPVKCIEMSRKRRVQAARNGPSPPPTPAGGPVAKPEISTADRLRSREGPRTSARLFPRLIAW